MTPTPRVLFLGDSLTAGLFASDEAHTFRAMLTDTLSAIPITVANSGGASSGFLTSQAEITAAAADIAIIELGTNDVSQSQDPPVLAALAANLRTLIGWARDGNADCGIVLLSTWSSWDDPVAADAAIQGVADDFGGHYVSLHEMHQLEANRGPANVFSPWAGFAANVVNFVKNPRLLEDGTTGFPAVEWVDYSDGHGTSVRDCIDNGDDTFYHETVYTVHADDLTGGDHALVGLSNYATDGAISPGDPVTFATEYQFFASNARAADLATIQVSAQDLSGGVQLNLGIAADWTPCEVTMTAGGSATYPVAWIRAFVKVATAVAGDTITFRWRHPRVTKTAAAVAYFHGGMGPGYEWNGAADASTSVALWYTDDFHPNDAGHAAIAAAVEPEALSALAAAGLHYRTVFTLDGLNLNDGTVYGYLPGVELGARQKTWTERRSYTGGVAQYNVSESASVPMKFPMSVQGRHLADLDAKVQAINAKIDGCRSDSPKSLVFAGTTYQITTTPRVAYALDEVAISLFRATFDLALNRMP